MIGRAMGWLRSLWNVGLTPRSGAALIFAFACVGIATAVRVGLGLISPDSAVFAPVLLRTLVAALVGGAESGTLATGLGAVAAYYLFVPPEWGLASFRLEQLVSLVLYGTSSIVIIWAAQSYRGLLQRLRASEATRELLNRELMHRIKNILANVQGIIGQALVDQKTLRNAINARITALAATNELLVRSGWQEALSWKILIHEFAPYGLSRFQLRGDDVCCPSALAVLLALVVHELTTNAVKYGALSSPDGRIDIAWTNVSVSSRWNGLKAVDRNQQYRHAKALEPPFFGPAHCSSRVMSSAVSSGPAFGADFHCLCLNIRREHLSIPQHDRGTRRRRL